MAKTKELKLSAIAALIIMVVACADTKNETNDQILKKDKKFSNDARSEVKQKVSEQILSYCLMSASHSSASASKIINNDPGKSTKEVQKEIEKAILNLELASCSRNVITLFSNLAKIEDDESLLKELNLLAYPATK